MDPSNGFRLIFPRAEGEDDTKYNKYLRKAHEIWKVTTETLKTCDVESSNNSVIPEEEEVKQEADGNSQRSASGPSPG